MVGAEWILSMFDMDSFQTNVNIKFEYLSQLISLA